ncbi:MAG TPA: alpha/beta hydrolase [Acidimicrobiales bacterium]
MSWALLVVGAVSAALVVNAFMPARRNVVLFLPSFIAASLTIELAWLQLAVGLALCVLLVLGGALDGWAGWVGLVLLVISWVALLVTMVWSRSSAHAAEAALADLGLVEDPPPHHRVRRSRNVPFARAGGRVLKLDVFAPADPPPPGSRRPAILQIHGGAWVVGDKRQQGVPLLKALARHGWVGFNANYRLSPAATWPDHLVDVKRALAFIREHADEYGVDPRFVAVTGGSAGGHLAAMVALTEGDPQYQPGFEEADTSVQACVPFYAVFDFTNRAGTMPSQFRDWFLQPLIMKAFFDDEPERFRAASPLDNVRPDAPPFFVIHGDRDTLAPVTDARAFVEAMRAVSEEPVRYLELHGAQHAFDVFSSIRARRVVKAVERFLAVQWRRHLGPQTLDPTES